MRKYLILLIAILILAIEVPAFAGNLVRDNSLTAIQVITPDPKKWGNQTITAAGSYTLNVVGYSVIIFNTAGNTVQARLNSNATGYATDSEQVWGIGKNVTQIVFYNPGSTSITLSYMGM